MKYLKGQVVRDGWTYIYDEEKTLVAIVHPKHVDRFLAAGDMGDALVDILAEIKVMADAGALSDVPLACELWAQGKEALNKAEGK